MLLEEVTILTQYHLSQKNSHNTGSTLFFGGKNHLSYSQVRREGVGTCPLTSHDFKR